MEKSMRKGRKRRKISTGRIGNKKGTGIYF